MIRVAIAGTSAMLRTGIETLVRSTPDFELTLMADQLESVPAELADVVVTLEADLEAIEGAPPVVLISSQTDAQTARAALQAGAHAVLSQDCSAAELTAAIQAAAAGLIVMRSSDFDVLCSRGSAVSSPAALTPREIEVLRLLADGLANKEIGYRLGISEHTVKFHVNSILTRMDASSRAEAVAIGMRQGLILL